jgi:hypothetical protein
VGATGFWRLSFLKWLPARRLFVCLPVALGFAFGFLPARRLFRLFAYGVGLCLVFCLLGAFWLCPYGVGLSLI